MASTLEALSDGIFQQGEFLTLDQIFLEYLANLMKLEEHAMRVPNSVSGMHEDVKSESILLCRQEQLISAAANCEIKSAEDADKLLRLWDYETTEQSEKTSSHQMVTKVWDFINKTSMTM